MWSRECPGNALQRGHQRAGMGNARKLRDAGVTTVPESLLQEQIVARESIAFLRRLKPARPERS